MQIALLHVEPCIFQGILEAVDSVQGAPRFLFGSVARGRAECLCGSIARHRHFRAGCCSEHQDDQHDRRDHDDQPK